MAKQQIKKATGKAPAPRKVTTEKQAAEKLHSEAEKIDAKIETKVEEQKPDITKPVQRPSTFFNSPEVVKHIGGGDKHLVRYLGTERYWSNQQIEICLKDPSVTLVIDGSVTNPSVGRFLEFPKKTQVVLRSKERKPCIGCNS